MAAFTLQICERPRSFSSLYGRLSVPNALWETRVTSHNSQLEKSGLTDQNIFKPCF